MVQSGCRQWPAPHCPSTAHRYLHLVYCVFGSAPRKAILVVTARPLVCRVVSNYDTYTGHISPSVASVSSFLLETTIYIPINSRSVKTWRGTAVFTQNTVSMWQYWNRIGVMDVLQITFDCSLNRRRLVAIWLVASGGKLCSPLKTFFTSNRGKIAAS